jgi:hypothetical protein
VPFLTRLYDLLFSLLKQRFLSNAAVFGGAVGQLHQLLAVVMQPYKTPSNKRLV